MTDEFDLGKFVGRRIQGLLGDTPGNLRPTSRAMLAQLRQAETKEAGTVPAIWPLTAEGIPDDLPYPLERERAIHAALTQFAVHQQSCSAAMHDPQVPFGRAVRKLAQQQASGSQELHDTAVYRRFSAMSTATSLSSLLVHARGIISQLRSKNIAFNYAAYANNLYWFQIPGQAAKVQRQWGRDFHRLIIEEDSNNTEKEN